MTRNLSLTPAQLDRACGVLIGSAAGDALGAGYEFAVVPPDLEPEMIGGGLGDFAPGEWTDDTAQAVAIAQAAASGGDLRDPAVRDAVADGLLEWFAGDPADVGVQTRSVLARAGRRAGAEQLAAVAREVHRHTGRSAGNGSLMRTGPVALAHLGDPEALVEAARGIGALTHYQDHAQEACALWSLMIRHAVLHGELPTFDDVAPWVPNRELWRERLAEAARREPRDFTENGWAVGALQAAWSAVVHTPVPDGEGDDAPSTHLARSLTTAIRIGHDTDTVAAIAGALLGARWGMSAVPAVWRRRLHGWPGIDARELERLAVLIVTGGKGGKYGWPAVERIDYTDLQYGRVPVVRHPHDDGVVLAAAPALDDLPDDVGAVVTLCLTGRSQVPAEVEQVTFRLVDEAAPEANPHLDAVLLDAARTIRALRAEGTVVLVHCVAAYSRTPTVGIAYAMLQGVPLLRAWDEVLAVLPTSSPNRGFREALARLEPVLLAERGHLEERAGAGRGAGAGVGAGARASAGRETITW